jgi:hypothetical protein
MELETFAGCDGHHFLNASNASLPHFGDNAARLRGNRLKERGASPMLEYQVKTVWTAAAATSVRRTEPSHGQIPQVLLVQF